MHNSNTSCRSTFWVAFYFVLVLLPLVSLLFVKLPPGTGFWWDVAIFLGLAAAALMIGMFLLTARFRCLTAPFGIDIIYYFHRQIGILILLLVIAHPVILLLVEPLLVYHFKWSSPHILAGLIALLSIFILLVTSILRRRIRMAYELWRWMHVVVSLIAIVTLLYHIFAIHYYTAAPYQTALWLLMAVAWFGILFYVRFVKPTKLLKQPWRVQSVKGERGHAWTLTLSPDGHKGLNFSPGQFAWLSVQRTPFALAEHPFSIASSSEQPGQLQFTIKELGDFTRTVKSIRPQEYVYVDGPYGVFSVDYAAAKNIVLIAGGIGIVPIMSMLRSLADRQSQKTVTLIYGYKSEADLTFREELDDLLSRLDLKVIYVLTEPSENWQGETGYIDYNLLKRYISKFGNKSHFYICGPTEMMTLTERSLRRLGVAFTQIHSEIFTLV